MLQSFLLFDELYVLLLRFDCPLHTFMLCHALSKSSRWSGRAVLGVCLGTCKRRVKKLETSMDGESEE